MEYCPTNPFRKVHKAIARLFVFAFTASLSCSHLLADEFIVHAGVRFLTPTSAELHWESDSEGPGSVAYGSTRKLEVILESKSKGTSHTVVLRDLKPATIYHYRIAVTENGRRKLSRFFEFDGSMNYATPRVGPAKPDETELPKFDRILSSLKHLGGFTVVDQRHAKWIQPILEQTEMTVVTTVDEESSLQQTRKSWAELDSYGIRLSVQLAADLPPRFANLVVIDRERFPEFERSVAPRGIIVCMDQPSQDKAWQWTSHEDSFWIGSERDPTELTRWGHQYGSAASGSFVGENLGGVDDTEDLEIRWLGRPGADFGIDRNPRMPAPLAVGGRLFHQGMNRMIALDAFNGSVLWSLEMPELRRVNIPRDCSNWCADTQTLFVATRDRLWAIDAATGKMLHAVQPPEPHKGECDWGYVAVTDELLIGTTTKKGSAYEDYWAKASWYDGKGDSTTAKVCGNGIVVFDKKYGDVKWQRPSDAIVHSTITISDGRMYFVEVDDPALNDAETGKLTNQQIWKNASVICLDLETGRESWKQPVPSQADDQVVAFGLANEKQFIFQSSFGGEFHFLSWDSQSGVRNWERSVKWPSDNHGAHMQHAVLMNDKLFVQPHILSAIDGTVLKSGTLGKRRGCATPIGAGNSIIYRGGTGPLSLWSLNKEKPSEFTRLRPSCWLSTIPAQGMLFSPEAGGGCSCGGWMECSIGFAPKDAAENEK